MQLRQQISEADLELRCNIQDGALCDNILDVAAVQDPPLNTILTVIIVLIITALEILDCVKYLPNGSAPHTEGVIKIKNLSLRSSRLEVESLNTISAAFRMHC